MQVLLIMKTNGENGFPLLTKLRTARGSEALICESESEEDDNE